MGKIAFVFAGQGAQKPGMGRSIYNSSAAAREAMDQAERIRPGTLEMCFEGPEASLKETINTQPCLMLVDYACAVAAREAGVLPDCAAGFSLGEVAAAAFCGMMTFEDAFRLVIRRAELMQACAERHPGAMGAVLRLSAHEVGEIASEFENVFPVNFNCPGQTVVAMSEDVFDAFSARVSEKRGRVMRLNVSGAFHSPSMQAASEGLAHYLSGISLEAPRIPLYANRTAQPYAGNMKKLLALQVSSPVHWEQTVRNMAAYGVDTFVEVGAGATLSGLISKTVNARVFNVEDAEGLIKLTEDKP